jgi:hypothetical protein
MIVVSCGRKPIMIWDLKTGLQKPPLRDDPFALADGFRFSEDGKKLLGFWKKGSLALDPSLCVWDLGNPKPKRSSPSYELRVRPGRGLEPISSTRKVETKSHSP